MMKVGVLAATGMVGQKFIELLNGHPWFEVTAVAASERSRGQKYREVAKWRLSRSIPESVADLEVLPVEPKALKNVDVLFSALPADIAAKVEGEFAQAGQFVFSNAAAFRMEPDVPILLPEINSDHVVLIEQQRKNRKWDGAIVTNSNCTTAGLVMSLKPILDDFGINRVFVSSMQALSGAGYPGVASLDIVDNVIPFIRNEEEKVQSETLKMLGKPGKPADFKVSASCHRVATLDGHLEAVFVETGKPAQVDAMKKAMRNFTGEPQKLRLPSAPQKPIIVREEEDRPQPKLDRMEGRGMSAVVGRVRKDPAFNGVKYVVLSHNTVRGAAGCSVLNAEFLKIKKYL